MKSEVLRVKEDLVTELKKINEDVNIAIKILLDKGVTPNASVTPKNSISSKSVTPDLSELSAEEKLFVLRHNGAIYNQGTLQMYDSDFISEFGVERYNYIIEKFGEIAPKL